MEYQVSGPAHAAPEEVWRLFVDVERWPQLTKSIREVRRVDTGPFQVGSEAIIRQPGSPRARWRVTELEQGRSFRWETSYTGVTVIGIHRVDPTDQGSEITLTLRLRGPMAGVVGALTGRRTQRNITMELAGFQRTAEPARG
jgi:uncharacterized membrane protein